MKTFLVIAIGNKAIPHSKIQDAFEYYYAIIEDLVWMVASSDYTTPRNVCTALGIYPPSERSYTGMVVDLSSRNGFASEELVNTLHEWEEK